jgi:hypothetical protein
MKNEVTLTQLAAEMAQLQQQIEQMNQRLDMIYGAVTRLAQTKTPPPPAADPVKWSASPSPAEISFSAQALLDPGSMLASLHQHAVKAGLTIPTDSMERLQAELPAAEVNDDRP